MHLNDARDGTNVATEVLGKYKVALEQKGMVSRNDLYKDWLSVRQDQCATARSVGFTAW